mmetsp:Transcript_40976/g.85510  ORF Transcript_40976/g.85510 Transcript_40976/m.85510 type:complete len:172 (-) Transcript_40976:45-560(-)
MQNKSPQEVQIRMDQQNESKCVRPSRAGTVVLHVQNRRRSAITGQRALSQTLHSTPPIKFLVENTDLKGWLHVMTAATRWDVSCRSVAMINEHRSTNALKKKDNSVLRPESRGSTEFFTWNTKEAVMGTRNHGMGIVEIRRRHISKMYKELGAECIADENFKSARTRQPRH